MVSDFSVLGGQKVSKCGCNPRPIQIDRILGLLWENCTIYGTTTKKEREELAEEGIDLLSIPWVDKDN